MKKALTYDDVTLVPRFSDIRSREEVDISAFLHKGIELSIPVISAPMDTVTGDFEERACALYDAGARVICVDVAHGHHVLVKEALQALRDVFGEDIHLMSGNVATLDAFNYLIDWGADSVRCSVGAGSVVRLGRKQGTACQGCKQF